MCTRRIRLTVVAVLLALVASGCGNGGSSTSTTRDGGSPLKVAVLVNETGAVLSGEERAPAVLRAWVKAQNAKGGVAGHPVELLVKDTKGDAATATAAVAKVVGDSSVVAAISFDANAEGVYAKKLVAAGIPVIGGMGFDPRTWGALPNWYSVTTNFPAVINSTIVLAKSVGANKPSYAVCAEVATCEAIGGIAEKASAALGLHYAGTIKLAAASPSYTAQCLAMLKNGVDFVVLGHGAQIDLRFASECKKQGYTGRLGMAAAAVEPELLQKNDPGVPIEFALNAFPWYASQAPVQAYRAMMHAEGVPQTSWADPHGTAAYATLELFKKVLDANASALSATPTKQDVVKAYGTVKDETLGGLLPQPLTFTEGNPAPLVDCYWLGRFDAGTFSGDGLDKPTCDPFGLKG